MPAIGWLARGVGEATDRYRRGLPTPFGRLARRALVAAYSKAERQQRGGRRRALRRDFSAAVEAVLRVIVRHTDLRTGLLLLAGAPGPGGAPPRRMRVADLALQAFGSAEEAAMRRAERVVALLAAEGLLATWRTLTTQAGETREDVAIRRVDLARIADLVLDRSAAQAWRAALRRDRAALDARHGPVTLRDQLGRRASRVEAAAAARRTASAAATAAIAAISDVLGRGQPPT